MKGRSKTKFAHILETSTGCATHFCESNIAEIFQYFIQL
jgi:hypothetical protein